MLFFDIIACLASALLLMLCRTIGASSRLFEPILWTSAMGIGLGVASGNGKPRSLGEWQPEG